MTQQQKPGFQIRRLQQSAVAIFLREMAQAGHDLTPVQYAVLSSIAVHPGLDQAGHAGQAALDKATMGGVVDRLVGKGLIARTVNPANRRARILSLTDKGRDVLNQCEPVVNRVQDNILAGLSDLERAQFTALLDKVVEATRDESRTPAS
ncbi:MarR family transcriptional regulator [uncultured Devosia sp.]|uniref:MarR family winged helix-turn-helix transcriptional regulator n=1 Tax=uncultured Devosia sp. TaxID=211434 RepID=UPI0026117889|nr:MarR family transcriptional regulator [uncultured Devosia sp.]